MNEWIYKPVSDYAVLRRNELPLKNKTLLWPTVTECTIDSQWMFTAFELRTHPPSLHVMSTVNT